MASAVDFQLEVIQSLVTSCWKKTLLKFEGAGAAFEKNQLVLRQCGKN
jgi:hypothetical protein